MKLSAKFKLRKNQHELDFIDIDPSKDYPLYLDPFFLGSRTDPWSKDASATIHSFFRYVIELIKAGKVDFARKFFGYLNEPNETCLGVSKGKPRGRGIGDGGAAALFKSILQSKAAHTGLLEDLEDTAIFIDDIGPDKVSDMTTNIIRKHLINYTQSQCRLWGIALTPNVPSGPYWKREGKIWANEYTEMLVMGGKRILLVPKGAVSYYKIFIEQQYRQHFVLNYLQAEHLRMNTPLVQRHKRKDGSERVFVTKKDIAEKEDVHSKEYLREFTLKHPEVFANFKKSVKDSQASIENEDLEQIDLASFIDYLISELKRIRPGAADAHEYHMLMLGILEFIFYPSLDNPQKEREIYEGRKRIDLTFDNAAKGGFFESLHRIHKITSGYIFGECKNYSSDPTNPELDQLSGRFSVNSSRVGLLLCRTITNMPLFLSRCKDVYKAKGELILPITDSDIVDILTRRKNGEGHPEEVVLADKMRGIVMG